MYYLDPKNDITFRKVFGQHPQVLKSFLNALLPLPQDSSVAEIEYLTPELLPDIPALKNTIVDIRCRDAMGRQFLVEMQMLWTDSFESRILFNACKAFSHQIGRGKAYDLLAPVYSLNIINESFSEQQAVWYHHYRLTHQSLPELHMDGIDFVSVELPNFIPGNYSERKITSLWLRFLKEIKNRSTMVPEELLEVPEIAEAVEALKETSYSPLELEQYEKYWDILRTQQSLVNDAMKKGKRDGKMEIAKTLIESGYPPDEILKITGLKWEDINR